MVVNIIGINCTTTTRWWCLSHQLYKQNRAPSMPYYNLGLCAKKCILCVMTKGRQMMKMYFKKWLDIK